jgi:hypothetical protein
MVDVVLEPIGTHRDRLQLGDALQRLGQFFGHGQGGLSDQHRDDLDASKAETGDDLTSHPVVGVVETPATVLYGGQPVGPDDRQQDVTVSQRLF